MMVLDLELPEALRARLAPLLVDAELEWAHTDVPEGTAGRTLRAAAERGLDRLAIADDPSAFPTFVEVLLGVATAFPAAAVVLTMHGAVLHLAASSGTDAQRARVMKEGFLWGFGAAPPADGPRAAVERTPTGPALRGSLRRVSGAGAVDGVAALVPYGDKNAILLIETDRPGVRVEPSWPSAGLRASSTRAIHFEGVAVDRDDVVTLVGAAWDLASWETAMIGLCAVCAGIARRAALMAIDRLRDDRTGPVVRRSSRSELMTTIEEATAAMAITRALAARARRGSSDRVALLGAKRATAAAAERAVAAARAVVGMESFEPPHPLERLSRDALGVRHFFPVDPVALDVMLEEIAPDAPTRS